MAIKKRRNLREQYGFRGQAAASKLRMAERMAEMIEIDDRATKKRRDLREMCLFYMKKYKISRQTAANIWYSNKHIGSPAKSNVDAILAKPGAKHARPNGVKLTRNMVRDLRIYAGE